MAGLHITEYQLQKERVGIEWQNLFFCTVFEAGAFRIILTGFSESPYMWGICVLAGVITAILVNLIDFSRWREWNFLIVTVITAVVILLEMTRIKNGILIRANEWLTFLTGKTGKIYLDFPVSGENGKYLVPILMAGYLSALLMQQMLRRKIVVATGVFLVCLAGCASGFLQVDAAVLLLTAGYCGLLVQPKIRELTGKIVLVLFALCIAGIAGYLIYQKIPLDTAREEVTAKLHEERYDHGHAILSDGNLRNPGSFQKSEKTALEVRMDEPQKMYLRGMTADVYTGSSWESLEPEAYQSGKDLFYWLHKSDFFGQCTIGQAIHLMDDEQKSAVMEIKNISACEKYSYLPYGLADTAGLADDGIGDDRNLSGGSEQKLEYYTGSIPRWYQTAVWLSANQQEKTTASYLAKEESYRKFVYQYDLQLTNTAIGVCEQLFADTEAKENRSLPEILDLIQKILDDKLEYNEDTVTYNGENDFFKYTMEQSKSGYCVQYATAATLMLRYLGVPARYVEGYYLSPQVAETCRSDEYIRITKSQAHAWAEYYLDGVGWIPLEVTPGYIDEEENQEVTEILADGQGTGEGQTFQKSSRMYTPPQHQQEKETAPDQRPYFQMRVRYILTGILLLMLVVILAVVIWSMRRRKKLLVFWENVKNGDRRTAITDLYGYSQMLIRTCGIDAGEENGEIEKINTEARFSAHEMEEEQRQKMTAYVEKVIQRAKMKKGFWKRFREHYLLWLYH